MSAHVTPPVHILSVPTRKDTMGTGWVDAHNRAIIEHQEYGLRIARRTEFAILSMVEGIWQYVQVLAGQAAHNDGGFDGVLAPGIGEMISGLRVLLNGDLGRLDAGTIESWTRYVCEQMGYDLDLQEMKA